MGPAATVKMGAQFQQLAMLATPKEVAGYRSGDHFLKPMAEAEPHMREQYDPRRRGEPDFDHHLGALYDDVQQHEGIEVPVRVRHFISGATGGMENELVDGHHRALLAMKTNRLLPVIHHEEYDGERHAATHTGAIIAAGQRDAAQRDIARGLR